MKNYLIPLLTFILISPTWANPASLDDLPTGVMPLLAEELAKSNQADYAPTLNKGVVKVSNSRHQLAASFNQQGAELKIHNTQLNISLQSLGRGDQATLVNAVQPIIDGVKVIYNHKTIQHWFINSPLGLEHGFTLTEKPKGKGDLKLALKLISPYRAELSNNQLVFKDKNGETKLNYGQLKSWDAKGKALVSVMAFDVNTQQLALAVQDEGAVYPITVDPLFESVTNIVANDRAADDQFGFSISASENSIAVGAHYEDRNGTNAGAVYIFTRLHGTGVWSQTQKLLASDGSSGDFFGYSVSLSADTLLVGARGDNDLGGNAGAAYVFSKIGGRWIEQKKLHASNGVAGDEFGYAVSVDGDIAVIGAWNGNGVVADSGVAYVFVRGTDNSWNESAVLQVADGVENDRFGISVGVSGDVIVVGDYWRPAVYIYRLAGELWPLEQKLVATNVVNSDGNGQGFGLRVSLNGSVLLVGAPWDDVQGSDSGAAYVYEFNGGSSWVYKAKLSPTQGKAGDLFGWSVAVTSDLAFIGAKDGSGSGGAEDVSSGRAYVYRKTGTGWFYSNYWRLNDGAIDAEYSAALAISGNIFVASDYTWDDGNKADVGIAYVNQTASGATVLIGASDAVVETGEQIEYSFQIVNNETSRALSTTTLALVFPAGISWFLDDGACAVGGSGVVCTVGSVAADASTTINVTVTANTEGRKQIVALLSPRYSAGYLDPISSDNLATKTTLVHTSPDISGTPGGTIAHGLMYVFTPTIVKREGFEYSFDIQNKPDWAAVFDSATGMLWGEPPVADSGIYSDIIITVTDGIGFSSLPAFSIEVTNSAPTITGAPTTIIAHDFAYSFNALGADSDNDPLTYSITNKPTWANFDTTTGELSGTPLIADTGITSAIVISVTDGGETVALPAFSLEVTNTAPTITGSPTTIIAHDVVYSFSALGADSDNDPLTYSIINKPVWANFDTTTGALSGTPLIADTGTSSAIVISVTDGDETVVLPAFSIEVTNTAPTITGTPTTIIVHDVAYSFSALGADSDDDPLTYSIINKPTWANFDTTTGALSGTPLVGDTGTTRAIVISVTDGGETAVLPAFDIEVTNTVPTLIGTPETTIAHGTAYRFAVSGTDSDPLTYSITNRPTWAAFNPATGELSGTPRMSDVGTTTGIVISVTDGAETVALPTFSIEVTNAAPTITGTPNTAIVHDRPYSFTPNVIDIDGDTPIFTINNKPFWASFDETTGALTGAPAAIALYTDIVISVSDGLEFVSLSSFNIEVTNAAPIISGTPVSTVAHSSNYSFTPIAVDADGDMFVFGITNKPDWASFDSSTGELSGMPAVGDSGSHPNILISISDGIEQVLLPAFSIEVTNTLPRVSGTPLSIIAHKSFYRFVPNVVDADGNNSFSFAVANKPVWANFNTSTGELSGTPSVTQSGDYTDIIISVNDGAGLWISLPAFSINVTNNAPIISGTAQDTVIYKSRYSFIPTASDPDGDELTFSLLNKPGWVSFDTSTGELSGTPSESNNGVSYRFVISVTDGNKTASLPEFSIAVTSPASGEGTTTTGNGGGAFSLYGLLGFVLWIGVRRRFSAGK